METTRIAVGVAFAAAFMCGIALFLAVRGFVAKRGREGEVLRSSGVRAGPVALALRRGFPFLMAPARFALRNQQIKKWAEDVAWALERKGYTVSLEAGLSVLFLLVLGVLIAAWALSSSVACGLALGVCVVLLVGAWTKRNEEEYRNSLRDAIPEALQTMSACFRVGYSLRQTLEEVQRSASGPLSGLFGDVVGVLESGGSVDEALDFLKERASEPELVFLAAALEIQHRTGSSMQQVLDVARKSVSDEINLKRSLRTQTAQARLSAQVVTAMPFVIIGVFSLVSGDFLSPFFETPLGWAMLGIALGMQALGTYVVHKMLKVEVV